VIFAFTQLMKEAFAAGDALEAMPAVPADARRDRRPSRQSHLRQFCRFVGDLVTRMRGSAIPHARHSRECVAMADAARLDLDPHIARTRLGTSRSTTSNGAFALETCTASSSP